MTHAKKLKKKIRARAGRTGESYTTARRHVLTTRAKQSAPAPETKPAPMPSMTRGAVSSAKVLERTGRPLEHWFAVLDSFGAKQQGHTLAARHLAQAHGVDGWYTQAITVAYERHHGLRALNQRADGDYEVSVSRVVSATPAAVAAAFNDTSLRRRWLAGQDRTIGAGLREERRPMAVVKDGAAARLRFKTGANTVQITVDAKPNRRASVVATAIKLARSEDLEEQRAVWRSALESLKASLVR